MAGLDGTIKTPIGPVQKKTALIIGGGVVVLGFIVWYRSKQLDLDEEMTDPDAPINPATGYPYGSPEDAAALAEQASYISPPDPSGGGSGNIPPSNVGFATNGAWVQGVVSYMIGNGLVDDPTKLSAALGKYITGAYADNEAVSLIQQAIAVQGFPPLAGPTGYPPSINRTPPSTTTPPPSGGTTTYPRGTGWTQVKKNESIKDIERRTGKTLDELKKLNSPTTFNRLTVGEWFKYRSYANPKSGYKGK